MISLGSAARVSPNPNRKRPSNRASEAPVSSKKAKIKRDPVADLDTVYYEIQGILKERKKNGRVWKYLIAWEGLDPETGQPYEPTWEPVSFVTQEAIDEWEREKLRAGVATGNAHRRKSSVRSLGVSSRGSSPSSREDNRMRRGAQPDDSDFGGVTGNRSRGTPGSRRTGGTASRLRQSAHFDSDQEVSTSSVAQSSVVERTGIAANSTSIAILLPAQPPFDTSEYLRISQSQSQSQSTQATQQASQPISEGNPEGARSLIHQSAVIPDSQELSGYSLSGTTNSGPRTGQSQSQLASQSSSGRAKQQSTISIPSHQVELHVPQPSQSEQGRVDFGSTNGGQKPAHSYQAASVNNLYSQSELEILGRNSFQISQGANSSGGDPVFLTQLEYEPPAKESGAKRTSLEQLAVSQAASGHSQHHQHLHQSLQHQSSQEAQSHHPPSFSVRDATASHVSSQNAQIVPNSSVNSVEDISSQSQSQAETRRAFDVYNDQYQAGVIPESNLHNSQDSSQALSELDGNTRLSSNLAAGISQSLLPLPEKSSGGNNSANLHHHPLPSQSVRESSAQAPANLQLSPSSSHLSRPSPSATMDGAPGSDKPLSALESFRQIQEQAFSAFQLDDFDAPQESSPAAHDSADNAEHDHLKDLSADFSMPHASASLPVPSVEMEAAHLHSSPVFEHRHAEFPISAAPVFNATSAPMGFHEPVHEQPATLDPSALTLSIEHEVARSPSIPTDDGFVPSHLDEVPIIAPDETSKPIGQAESQEYPRNILPYVRTGPNEHLITLPLANNMRNPYYDEMRKHMNEIDTFIKMFTSAASTPMSPALVYKVNRMLTNMKDICDLPPFMETVGHNGVSAEQISKHARGSNSKFAFIGEFVDELRRLQSEKKVLILAQTGKPVELLNTLVRVELERSLKDDDGNPVEMDGPEPIIVVKSTIADLSSLPNDFDAVIAFDHTFHASQLRQRDDGVVPITMALVISASAQHIDLRISEKPASIERTYMLLLALLRARQLIESPDHGFSEPHAIAKSFATYIEAPDDDFYWTPQELPETVFEDIPSNSQSDLSQSSREVNSQGQLTFRKRPNDNADEPLPKRQRTSQPPLTTDLTHISDSLRSMIGDDSLVHSEKPTMPMSVERMEAIAAKVAKLEADLVGMRTQRDEFRDLSDRSKKEVDSWDAWVKRMQPRYMAAMRDRGIMKKDRDDARNEAKTLSFKLSQATKENTTLTTANTELKEKLGEATTSLLNSDNPETAKIAKLEKDLQEATDKLASLEKRLALRDNDYCYLQDRYQEASESAAGLANEKLALERRNEELARKADNNILLINQTQSRNENKELSRQVKEQRTIVREREMELGRVREQLAAYKNTRRETRQSPVPRSPRLGVLSPRNAGGSRAHSHSAVMGTGSRGTSPAAPSGAYEGGGGNGPQFFGQNGGNGRYSHLRE
ncbi:hypothetical protein PG996_015228 [Apiospora saccharicola]|uniref:Chromo domain-containing protein n=1 Tax=Apiospora saccharicola TaxID=335842 RepID=A0ABR1TN78_9PEZI